MQYSVRPAGLLSCGEELENVVRKLRQNSDELEKVIRRLKPQWCMDEMCVLLRREQEKLEEQIQLALVMAQAVRRCCGVYQNTERQVLENLDCPRHVLTDDGTGGAICTGSAQSAAAAGWSGPAYQPEPGVRAELDWDLDITACAAVLTQIGVTVRLED